MQVMSIGNAAAEMEAPTPNANAPEAAAGGFASMLAMLLATNSAGTAAPLVDAEVNEVEAADTAEETPSVETAEATETSESEGALNVLAAALATPVPTAPPATTEATPPQALTANVEALSPTPATSVTIEPPETQAPTETTTAQVAPSVTDVESEPVLDAPAPAAPAPARSHANHTIVPHPARTAEELAPATVAQAVPVTPATAQPDGTSQATPVAEATPVAATLAAAPQTLARATVSTASVLGRDAVAVDEADSEADVEAPTNVPRAATTNAVATAEDADALEPPAPAPVLERNTVVLARNALNDQVRESSSRELLASARDPEPRAEKSTDAPAPPLLTGTEAVARNLPGTRSPPPMLPPAATHAPR
jgi:ribonuclease E